VILGSIRFWESLCWTRISDDQIGGMGWFSAYLWGYWHDLRAVQRCNFVVNYVQNHIHIFSESPNLNRRRKRITLRAPTKRNLQRQRIFSNLLLRCSSRTLYWSRERDWDCRSAFQISCTDTNAGDRCPVVGELVGEVWDAFVALHAVDYCLGDIVVFLCDDGPFCASLC